MASVDDYGKRLDILILGKAGSGKSRTGNSILGDKNAFIYGVPTEVCNSITGVRFGKNVNVIDTPSVVISYPDKILSINQTIEEGNVTICVICVQIGRFSDEDLQTYTRYTEYFDETLFQFSIVIFTKGDQWENDMKDKHIKDPNFDSYIENLSDQYKTLLHRCDDRYVVFNNRKEGEENDSQVEHFLTIVEKMLSKNSKQTNQEEISGIWRNVVTKTKTASTNVALLKNYTLSRVGAALTNFYTYFTTDKNIDGTTQHKVNESSNNSQGH